MSTRTSTSTRSTTNILVADNGYIDLAPRGKIAAINAATRYALSSHRVIVRVVDASTGEQVHAVTVDAGSESDELEMVRRMGR